MKKSEQNSKKSCSKEQIGWYTNTGWYININTVAEELVSSENIAKYILMILFLLIWWRKYTNDLFSTNCRGAVVVLSWCCRGVVWCCRGVVVIATAQLHSIMPGLCLGVSLNPAHSVSKIYDGKNLWYWSRLEIHHHHHHHHCQTTWSYSRSSFIGSI